MLSILMIRISLIFYLFIDSSLLDNIINQSRRRDIGSIVRNDEHQKSEQSSDQRHLLFNNHIPLNFPLLKYEISNYPKIIYIIFLLFFNAVISIFGMNYYLLIVSAK